MKNFVTKMMSSKIRVTYKATTDQALYQSAILLVDTLKAVFGSAFQFGGSFRKGMI